ncbi:hypothetical protein Tco_0982443 [Tanacetum coccineum]
MLSLSSSAHLPHEKTLTQNFSRFQCSYWNCPEVASGSIFALRLSRYHHDNHLPDASKVKTGVQMFDVL